MAYMRQYQMAGDPGLGKFFGGIGRAIGGIVKGGISAITGIPLGGGVPRLPAPSLPGVGQVVGKVPAAIGRAAAKFPGGKKGAAAAAAAAAAAGLGGLGIGAIPGLMGGGGGRRYRRMNVCNVRALRRSMRRVTGFAKEANKVMSFTKRHRLKKRGKR